MLQHPPHGARGPLAAMVAVATLLGLCSSLAASPWAEQERPAPSGRIHWLVVVDDLHLDFRSTGRLRDLLRAFADATLQNDDLVSAMSTGPSLVDASDSIGPGAFKQVVAGITGNGLKDEDAVNSTVRTGGEVAYRARRALAAVTSFVEGHHTSSSARTRVLLVISRGWAIEPNGDAAITEAADLDALDGAIAAAGAIAIALTPADIPSAPLLASEAARRHAGAKAASLQRLVQPSGGFAAVVSAEGRAAVTARIRAAAGR